MPDGDRVHPRLAYHYQKPYKQICEGQFENKALAREVVRAMIKDIRKYGNDPITLIKRVADQLEQLPTKPHFAASIDWDEESRTIDKLSQQIYGIAREGV